MKHILLFLLISLNNSLLCASSEVAAKDNKLRFDKFFSHDNKQYTSFFAKRISNFIHDNHLHFALTDSENCNGINYLLYSACGKYINLTWGYQLHDIINIVHLKTAACFLFPDYFPGNNDEYVLGVPQWEQSINKVIISFFKDENKLLASVYSWTEEMLYLIKPH